MNSSPLNSSRGCLCKDGMRYSSECCKGELINQGIGNLNNQSSNTVTETFIAKTTTNTS